MTPALRLASTNLASPPTHPSGRLLKETAISTASGGQSASASARAGPGFAQTQQSATGANSQVQGISQARLRAAVGAALGAGCWATGAYACACQGGCTSCTALSPACLACCRGSCRSKRSAASVSSQLLHCECCCCAAQPPPPVLLTICCRSARRWMCASADPPTRLSARH